MIPDSFHLPLFLDLALTSRCLLRCRYCSVEKKPVRELSASEWVRVIRSFARLRPIAIISLEGGEPLLRADLPQILSACLDSAQSVKIVTSGMIPLRSIPPDLWRHPRFSIELSMDGPPRIHDFLRDQSWDRAFGFLRDCLQRGIRLRLRSVISRHNGPDMEDWLEELDDWLLSMGKKIEFLFDPLIAPDTLMDQGGPLPRLGLRAFRADGLVPSPAEIGILYRKLKTRNFGAIQIPQTEIIRGCAAARYAVLSFDPAGAFSFCCEAPGAWGRVFEMSFEEILSLSNAQTQNLFCRKCHYFHRELCHGCWTGKKCGLVSHWEFPDCRALYRQMMGFFFRAHPLEAERPLGLEPLRQVPGGDGQGNWHDFEKNS